MTASESIWSLRATLLWGLLIAGVFIGMQALVASIYVHLATDGLPLAEKQLRYDELVTDGDLLGWATVVSGVVGALLTIAAVSLKPGSDVRAYLGLNMGAAGQWLKWFLWFLGLLVVLELLAVIAEDAGSLDFMEGVYQSADSKLLLFIAVVVVASVCEELFFRGFLLEGLRHTFLGAGGSVVLTALLWSVVHVQYNAFGMASIFLIGIFLGLVRLRSGSTILAMVLHALNNAVAFFVLAHLSR